MSTRNKCSTNIETSKTELEATMNMRLDEFKSETVSFFNTKLPTHTSNKPSSSYDQPYADLIKLPLLKSSKKS